MAGGGGGQTGFSLTFGGGIKSVPVIPDGHFEVETKIDNPAIQANRLQLANLRGDRFTIPVGMISSTYKWETTTTGGTSNWDVDTTYPGKFWHRQTSPGGPRFIHSIWNTRLAHTGAFAISADLYRISFPSNAGSVLKISDGTYFVHIGVRNNVLNSAILLDGVIQDISVNLTGLPNPLPLLITKTAGNPATYMTFYHNGSNYVQVGVAVGSVNGPEFSPEFQTESDNNALAEAHFNDYHVFNGTLNTPFTRLSGNWISAAVSMPSGDNLLSLILQHVNLDASNRIDKVEILRASDNAVLTTTLSTITSGTLTELLAADFDNGYTPVNVDFKIRIYLVGDGLNDGPILTAPPVGVTGVPSAAPVIVLFNPPAGSEVTKAGTLDIGWVTSDDIDPPSAITVEIDYSLDGGISFNPIATVAGDTSPYQWNVPNIIAEAVMRVTATDTSSNVSSDQKSFSIVTPDLQGGDEEPPDVIIPPICGIDIVCIITPPIPPPYSGGDDEPPVIITPPICGVDIVCLITPGDLPFQPAGTGTQVLPVSFVAPAIPAITIDDIPIGPTNIAPDPTITRLSFGIGFS